MSPKKYFITSPLYYVNAKPHIGHAYTNVLCDVFARYRRMRGEDVFFLTGTDEHGTKIEKIAKEAGKEPKAFVDEMVPHFEALWKTLGIHYDHFIRTTDAAHKEVVRKILADLEKKGDIYKETYKGWYCTPCESFWTELQLIQAKCPDCHREVQELSEENYFFRLSKYQEWLVDYIHKHPDFVRPEMRKNEILGFLRQPLEDLCITRPRNRLAWGIDYPGTSDFVVYVWFDALINYVSAAHYGDDKIFSTMWPADAHLVGKDILRQHAVYWPIMLKACGLEMPKMVLAHGWWTMAGSKVSKSRGNAVDPFELVQKYSVDAFRYFLMREVTLGLDGAFSEDLLRERYTSDLANDLGNLWFRVASMLGKYFEGKVPEYSAPQSELVTKTYALWDSVTQAMDDYDPRAALNEIWSVITLANQFVETNKPWALAKDKSKQDELASTLGQLAECVAHIAILLLPFMPQTGRNILERLNLSVETDLKEKAAFTKPILKSGLLVNRGDALFPRLEDEKEASPT